MPEAVPDFQSLFTRLNQAGVRYVLIGGVAMVAHGSSHVTQDLDIGYDRSSVNLKALAQALASLHPRLRDLPPDLPFVWDERTLGFGTNFTLVTDEGNLDLLGQTPGVPTFAELWDGSLLMELFGQPVRVASIAHLIAMKRAANRPKDQVHLLELQALQGLSNREPGASGPL